MSNRITKKDLIKGNINELNVDEIIMEIDHINNTINNVLNKKLEKVQRKIDFLTDKSDRFEDKIENLSNKRDNYVLRKEHLLAQAKNKHVEFILKENKGSLQEVAAEIVNLFVGKHYLSNKE